MSSILALIKRNQARVLTIIGHGVVLNGFVFGTLVLGVTYLFLYGFEGREGRPFSSFWLEMIPVFILAGVVFQLLKEKENNNGKPGE